MSSRLTSLLLLVGVCCLLVPSACGDDEEVPPPPPSTPCKPPPRPTGTIKLEPAFGGAVFTTPVEIQQGPGGRFYVLEQTGKVKVVSPGAPPSVVIDVGGGKIVAGGESGLLGIAFDPKFAENGFFYLHFDENRDKVPGAVYQSTIARYTSTDSGLTADLATEKLIIKVDHPFSNHNGGRISFGPDGFLYWGLGDGGSSGDPRGNGQNKEALLGKILRLDVVNAPADLGYVIPPTNPFANGGGRPEIYAYGFRNPWKHSFDIKTNELWVADVGQMRFEEVNKVVLGGNYGWNIREGRHCFGRRDCPTEGLIDPVAEYPRSLGISTTGGYVYRGKRLPEDLQGKYIWGDFGSGIIFTVDGANGQSEPSVALQSNLKISTFGQDSDGEMYVADYASGVIYQLAPGDAPTTAGPGANLLETGCMDPGNLSAAPNGAIPYSVSSPLWSDGAQKERWLFVPEGFKIGVRPDGDFDLPPASVAVKTFLIGGKRIETRLFTRYADGGWAGFSYEWNDAGTDAVLLPASKTKDLGNGQTWYFPSRGECLNCHTPAAGFSLGLEARQLTDGNVIDRFTTLLDKPVTREAFPPLRAADSAGASNEEKARGYLHANCSICHREGSGAGAATLDLRIDRSLADLRVCNVAPQAGDLGVGPDAKIVAPGDPTKSTLTLRMRALDQNRMPTLASRVVDEVGTTAIETWIKELMCQ